MIMKLTDFAIKLGISGGYTYALHGFDAYACYIDS